MTAAQARERLLNLFPVAAIRSAWRLGNITKERAVEQLAKTASTQETDAFAFDHFTLTKQHVSPAFAVRKARSIGTAKPDTRRHAGTAAHRKCRNAIFLLARLAVRSGIARNIEQRVYRLQWPILLVVQPDLLMAKFTIMEKDVRSYFQMPIPAGSSSRAAAWMKRRLLSCYGINCCALTSNWSRSISIGVLKRCGRKATSIPKKPDLKSPAQPRTKRWTNDIS